MADSVHVLNLTERRFTREDIYEQLDIYKGTAHKIVPNDLAFLKVGFCWLSTMLTLEHKASDCSKNICRFGWEQLPPNSLLSKSQLFWFTLVSTPQRISAWNKVFQTMMKLGSGYKLRTKIPMLKEYKSLFFDGKISFQEWWLNLFSCKWNVNRFIAKFTYLLNDLFVCVWSCMYDEIFYVSKIKLLM